MNRILVATSFALGLLSVAGAQTLKLGDNAPALSPAKWVKGQPVTKLGNGKVNVVEFWATWCGPCKVSIPHLTDLAHKYKDKVTFTGVSVWESRGQAWDPKTFDKVESFVKDMGSKMDYRIAADGADAKVAKSWMEAAGQNGIPTAFVVGKDGKVLWIGHPMGGLEETLDKVIAGTYDLNAEKAKMEAAAAKEREFKAMMQPYSDAMKAKDYAKAVDALDAVMAKSNENEVRFAGLRFQVLLMSDEAKAYGYARELTTGVYKDDAQSLNGIAWMIVDDRAKHKAPDYATAVFVAERASALAKDVDPMILDTLAYAYFKNGDVDKAITTEEKAIALAEKDARVDAATKKELRDRLDKMKAKKS